MKIALYGKPYDNELNRHIDKLLNTAEAVGFDVDIYEKYAHFLTEKGYLRENHKTFNRSDVEIAAYQCLVSIGGDGTLLDTVTMVGSSGIPVVGINAGRLGFISSISTEEFEEVLQSLKSGNFECEDRTLISVQTPRNLFGENNYALNEVTLHKKDTASMVTIDAYLNGEFLNTYWADGIIVSTPTGSTAYSLSCGGPIVVPGSDNVILTPIAPHNLNVRPVVISNNSELKLKISGRSENFLIALDSRSETLLPEEEIIVTKAPFNFRLLRPEGHSFISTMRNKLGWGLDKRN
jgi:NAD+ kinase